MKWVSSGWTSTGEAISLGLRFYPLTAALSCLEFEISDRLMFRASTEHLRPEIRTFVLLRDICASSQVAQDLIGTKLPPTELWLESGLDILADRYMDLQATTIRHGMPEVRAYFPLSILDVKLPLANKHTLENCILACRELAKKWKGGASATEQARSFILHNLRDVPSLEFVASAMRLSPRTLRRRLQGEGSSYIEIVKDVRRKMAEQLLLTPKLTISEIADRLGYSDPQNLSFAFRQWTGLTPAEFRKNARSGCRDGNSSKPDA